MNELKDNSISKYKPILDYLYKMYYEGFTEHSSVTSSHWKELGQQIVSVENGTYKFKGLGFGEFKSRGIVNGIQQFPIKILLSYLLRKHNCPQYLLDCGKNIVQRMGCIINYDHVKQILSVSKILKTLGQGESFSGQGIKTVCVIGDGYGFFSNLLRELDSDIKVITVNIGRTLFFDVQYSERCFPDNRVTLVKTKEDLDSQILVSQQVFIEAENYNLLENLEIDLFINIASMMEMDHHVVDNYFKYMRSSPKSPCYFYCCNRVRKELPDGTVTEFLKYPWKESDEILLDECCPSYQKYPASLPPFWRPLDGEHQHRLVKFK
ncbi:MAG: putative sugar O-methyltransferase [Mariprofundaceae bacterium]|nr:putative sugar O-methyltransferase [Mariprofundaceae bacterium]